MAAIDQVPKSRITIRYSTEINGQMKDKEIPFRLLVVGDLSNGSSMDRKLELDERRIRELDGKNINETMKDMKIDVNMSVANMLNPDKSPMLDLTIPIEGLNSFNPAKIAENVPQLKSLLKIKKLIQEFDLTIDNNKNFRKSFGNLLANKEAFDAEKSRLEFLDNYMLPSNKVAENNFEEKNNHNTTEMPSKDEAALKSEKNEQE